MADEKNICRFEGTVCPSKRYETGVETKTFDSGNILTKVNLKITESWLEQTSGEKKFRSTYVPIIAWGEIAERMAEELTPNVPIGIVSSYRTRSWEDKDGNRRYEHEFFVIDYKILGEADPNMDVPPEKEEAKAPAKPAPESDEDDLADDIPF